mgnify:FL=1|tara:strand:- start:651 stop:2585 length:1935 start_codon:yes stop_codon:yes gene_type:complete
MKTGLYILSLFCLSFSLLADEGDTTFVQAHNYIDLDWNGNYDAWGVFPNGETTYRKILMHYDMACSSSGCSGWDYTTKIIILKESGELDVDNNPIFINNQTIANVVTPYGTYMQGNGTEGFSPNWVQRYTYDVTDFAHILVDSVKMRAFYGGWSTGFNVTLNFEFIEGTPPRNVIDVQNLWSGSSSYSSISGALNDTLVYIPDGSKNSIMRVTISGHGQDGEFTQGVDYHVKLNNNSLYTQEIWRDDCGENPLYPQGGTWIYDRANWCPGDKATTREHELTSNLQTGQDNLLGFDIYKANWNPSEASYIYDAQLITYAEPNFSIDAVMEDIIAPSNKQEYFRFNPTCSNPIVKIKNQGSELLTSVSIVYGFDGYDSNTYLWEGSLSFGETEIVDLPPIDFYFNESNVLFYARVNMPNNYPEDDYLINDVLYSEYEFVEEYPSTFAMWFKTNNVPSESSYELRDIDDNLIFIKSGMSANTIYKDTFNLDPGCYKFQILDTGGNQNTNEDGLSWWANNDGSGYARLREVPGGFFKYYQDDFGSEVTDYFRVGDYNVTLGNELTTPIIEIYPNPSNSYLNIDLELIKISDISVIITNINGKVIKSLNRHNFKSEVIVFDLSSVNNGLYNCTVITKNMTYTKTVSVIR